MVHRRYFSRLVGLAIVCICLLWVGSGQVIVAQTSASSSSRKTSAKKPAKKTPSKRKKSSPRLKRMHQAFVASATLAPMARALLQDRTPAAYAGVESYARRHAKEDAGALAYLVLGYGHVLDHDYAKAIDPLVRAKANAGDIGDYVAYYLGISYLQAEHVPDAIATFGVFDKDFPESLLLRDANVQSANALLASGKAQEAVDLLEKDRQPVRADLELTLGRGYAATGDAAKAGAIFRNLYYTMPLASESNAAQAELNKLNGVGLPAVAVAQRKTRADLLVKGKQFGEAANEYRDLLDAVTVAERPQIQLAMAEALRRSGNSREARKALDLVPTTPADMNAERLFNLGELERGSNDDDAFLRTLDQIRQVSPTSPWLEQALLSAGNIYLLRRDFDRAIDSYRECQQRFPEGARASYAHWKVAWLSLRQGRNAEAKKDFDEQVALYPSSGEIPAALYWRGRLAEEDNDFAMAGAYYVKLSQRFHNFYYGELARERLAKIKVENDANYPLLDRIPPIDSGSKIAATETPTDNLRVQKAQLLANGGLLDFAVRELKAAAEEDKGSWLAPEIARMYQDAGRYDIALEVMKRTTPNYFAVDLPSLPRAYWEALFPKPYWYDLKRFSTANALDPYLVASLIRQESEFNPNAVSRADAVGLMQLLPKVGRGVAKQEKILHFNTTQLFTPAINLQLGTKYFRGMVDRFGAFEYALAAYNAGTDRVVDWQGMAKYRDVQEFVESIPFTETREYVQAILRNASVYRQLYGAP